jgi:hypothetical protein
MNGTYSIRRRDHKCKIVVEKREGKRPRRSEGYNNKTGLEKSWI